MSEWMVEFKKYITLNFDDLENCVVDGLWIGLAELCAVICENLSLYVIKEEEVFQGYLSGFVEAVVILLVNYSLQGTEHLIFSAIKFLTAVSKSRHHTLLSSHVIINQIYESIVFPNVMLRDDEEELLELNPIEYIQRDMIGSSVDPIRRIACELFKGITTHYKGNASKIFMRQSGRCCLFNDNPKGNWKYKYCAIYLAASLATENADGTSVVTYIVDVELFFWKFLLEELINEDVTSFPMIKAAALKFFILFKDQFSIIYAFRLLNVVTRLLTSPNYAVAARFIDELLSIKGERDRYWYTSMYRPSWMPKASYKSTDVCEILPTLMSNLLGALSNPVSEEIPYVMKCIMHVVLVSDLNVDIASHCIIKPDYYSSKGF